MDRMNPESPIHLDPRQLPEEGLALSGESAMDIFELPEGPVQFSGPLQWNLLAEIEGDDVIVTGSASAGFTMECGRCLQSFSATVEIDNFSFDFPANIGEIVDLTERIREDILLDLPDNPRCDTHGGAKCPAAGQFLTEDDFVPLKETAPADSEGKAEDNIWGALDSLKASAPPKQEN
jgi:uncharacterized protein